MAQPLFRTATIFEDETELEMPTLHAILSAAYGEDYVDWDSDILKYEILEDYKEVGILTWSRIQAIRVMHKNIACWHQWEVFEKCCAAHAGMIPDFGFVQQQEPEEVAMFLHTMNQIGDYDFDKDVLGYIAATCLSDGLYWLPSPLNIAQPMMNEIERYNKVTRDRQSVTEVLRKQKEYNTKAKTEPEEQANKIIRIRTHLQAFEDKLIDEAAKYRALIK